jgi:hypothetical protein
MNTTQNYTELLQDIKALCLKNGEILHRCVAASRPPPPETSLLFNLVFLPWLFHLSK